MPRKNNGGSRGRGRGRGAGKITPKELFPPLNEPVPQSHDLALPGPSTRTYEEEKALLKKAGLTTQKALKGLSPAVQRQYLDRKRAKEMERILLPDAPPSRKSRKVSPDRLPCRLREGTPCTPPSPKPRPWEITKQQSPDIHSPSTPKSRDYEPQNWPTPTSAISLDSCLEVPGYSPLRIDWTTGNLKTTCGKQSSTLASAQSSLQSPLQSPLPKKKTTCGKQSATLASAQSSPLQSPLQSPLPKKKTTCGKQRATLASSKPSPLQSPLPKKKSTLNQERPPHKKQCPTKGPSKVIRGADIFSDDAQRTFDDWQKEIEAETGDDEEDDIPSPSMDYANSDAAAEDLDPVSREWLNQEDAEADKTIQTLLPIDHLTFDWSSDPSTFTGKREEFLGTPGPTFLLDDMTELDVFFKFFDNDMLDMIVTETNEYAKTTLAKKMHTTNSRINFWKDTDRGEIVVFLGILLLQGMSPLTVEKDYWRENGYLTLKYFKNLMTYNRFVLLKRFLHFSDNDSSMTEQTPDERKLRKIWPVLNHLNRKFSTLYLPGQNIAIDESLLKWHGRISFAQKIATKAAKVGIKSYELCESSSGYLWSYFVYTGKGHDYTDDRQHMNDVTNDVQDPTENDENRPMNNQQDVDPTLTDEPNRARVPAPTNATAQIVEHLAKPLLNQGYTLIMDNFYNGPLLARYLKTNKTDCFGTLRLNREFVPDSFKKMTKAEMRTGEVAQSFCRDLFVLMWRDTNIVSMISTYHGGDVGGKEKYGTYKYKPTVVLDYNVAMGGVDRKDQLLSAHKLERTRNIAWYKKVFRRMLNVSVLNSYIIFKTAHPDTTQRAFRQALTDSMIAKFLLPAINRTLQVETTCLTAGQLPGGLLRPILKGNHFIGTSLSKYRVCVWCRKSRTKYICKQCNLPLCLEICFEECHTVQ